MAIGTFFGCELVLISLDDVGNGVDKFSQSVAFADQGQSVVNQSCNQR